MLPRMLRVVVTYLANKLRNKKNRGSYFSGHCLKLLHGDRCNTFYNMFHIVLYFIAALLRLVKQTRTLNQIKSLQLNIFRYIWKYIFMNMRHQKAQNSFRVRERLTLRSLQYSLDEESSGSTVASHCQQKPLGVDLFWHECKIFFDRIVSPAGVSVPLNVCTSEVKFQ